MKLRSFTSSADFVVYQLVYRRGIAPWKLDTCAVYRERVCVCGLFYRYVRTWLQSATTENYANY